MSRKITPEQFVASSPIGERLYGDRGIFGHNLASSALRLVEINGVEQSVPGFGNNEVKTAAALNSRYFGIVNQNPEFIKKEIEKLIIPTANVTDKWFENQQRLHFEQGRGKINLTNEVKTELVAVLQKDQRDSLEAWADYLRNDADNGHDYPDWFKVYVWESLKTMGSFDKEKCRFKKRNQYTVAAWPELNPESLAYVYGSIEQGILEGSWDDAIIPCELLRTNNFARMYAYAMDSLGSVSHELHEQTEGAWVKYDQIADGKPRPGSTASDKGATTFSNAAAVALAKSLQGYNTGWCTANAQTAEWQLVGGDFYVFYTNDSEDKATVPRIAIRMKNGVVAEVRGIENGQNLESSMLSVAKEKLATLPGGDKYFKKVEDMKWLTELYNRYDNLPEGEELDLSIDDLAKLYELNEKIEGFGLRGNGVDTRLVYIRQRRNAIADLNNIFAEGKYIGGDLDLRFITSAEDLILPEEVYGNLNLRSITSAKGLILPKVVYGNLNLRSITSAKGLILPEKTYGNLILSSITSAEDLILPENTYGDIYLSSITSAKDLILPKVAYGGLHLSSITSAKDLILPKEFYGDLHLSSITSAKDLILPKEFYGDLHLSSITSAKDLILPKVVYGHLDLSGITSAEDLILPENTYGDIYLNSITSAKDLILPKVAYGGLVLSGITSPEDLILPEKIYGHLYLGITSIKGLVLPKEVHLGICAYKLTLPQDFKLPKGFIGKIYCNI